MRVLEHVCSCRRVHKACFVLFFLALQRPISPRDPEGSGPLAPPGRASKLPAFSRCRSTGLVLQCASTALRSKGQEDARGVTQLAMNGDAGYTREQVRARRAELQNELARILEQRQEIEARLAALSGARPVADAALAAPALAPRLSHGGLNAPAKKRPAAHGLEGPEAKRRLTLAERERRVNSLWGQCATVLKTITRHRGAGPFSKAVDPVLLRCPVCPS